jgi:two-component system cell cycle response regulator CtrA
MSGVIIIDDDKSIGAGLTMLFEIEGIAARATSSPFELPFIVAEMDPDVILLDLSMPAISGEAVLRTLARRKLRSRAAILIFSGREPAALAQIAEDLGADGFISKMDDTEQIVRKIRFWIGRREGLQRLGGER